MKLIENESFEEERSLYKIKDTILNNILFSGAKDGESPLKETKNLLINNSTFDLRYALWHNENSKVVDCVLSSKCRAPLWYSKNVNFFNIKVDGVKFLRECKSIIIDKSVINSEEFCWKSKDINIKNTEIKSVYPFFSINNLVLNNVTLKGKYSFQYSNNILIEDSNFDTKDAFWHTSNAVIKNSIIKGEYIGWYSNKLTFINCKIIGTQPFCYSKNIKLIDCEMEGADFAFENTTVKGNINSNVISIKNPIKCNLIVDSVNDLIIDEYKKKGKVVITKKTNNA